MNLSLSPEIQKLIQDRVKSGKYGTAEDVIAAAVATLEQQEHSGDFETGELERLLEEGEGSGAPLEGEAVLKELHDLRNRGQSKAG